MAMITYLAAVTAGAVDANGERMSTADRLAVTLTLMLTAVAYKFIVASSLPQVSYLTLIDTYVLACFLFMLLISLENVVWPAITAALGGEEPFDEIHIMFIFLGSFTLFNLAYLGRVLYLLAKRRGRQGEKRSGFEEARTLGLKWERVGKEKPLHGQELKNDTLVKELEARGKKEFNPKFTLEEWKSSILPSFKPELKDKDLGYDSFIRSGDFYFQPARRGPAKNKKTAGRH